MVDANFASYEIAGGCLLKKAREYGKFTKNFKTVDSDCTQNNSIFDPS